MGLCGRFEQLFMPPAQMDGEIRPPEMHYRVCDDMKEDIMILTHEQQGVKGL